MVIMKAKIFIIAPLIGWVHIKKPNLFFYSQISPFLPCQCDDCTESVPSSKPSPKSLNQLPRISGLTMSAIACHQNQAPHQNQTRHQKKARSRFALTKLDSKSLRKITIKFPTIVSSFLEKPDDIELSR